MIILEYFRFLLCSRRTKNRHCHREARKIAFYCICVNNFVCTRCFSTEIVNIFFIFELPTRFQCDGQFLCYCGCCFGCCCCWFLFVLIYCSCVSTFGAHNRAQCNTVANCLVCNRMWTWAVQITDEKRKKKYSHIRYYTAVDSMVKLRLVVALHKKKIDQITNSQSRSFVLSCPCQVYISKTIICAATFYTRNVSVHITFETEQREQRREYHVPFSFRFTRSTINVDKRDKIRTDLGISFLRCLFFITHLSFATFWHTVVLTVLYNKIYRYRSDKD